MADSVLLNTAVDSVHIPIAHPSQKTVPNGVQKAVLSDDVTLKLAEHIKAKMEVRHVLLISGNRNKQHVVEEMLLAKNEYLIPSQITKVGIQQVQCGCPLHPLFRRSSTLNKTCLSAILICSLFRAFDLSQAFHFSNGKLHPAVSAQRQRLAPVPFCPRGPGMA
jgi:hypothetical protein